jgi:hypothetical protein
MESIGGVASVDELFCGGIGAPAPLRPLRRGQTAEIAARLFAEHYAPVHFGREELDP